MTKSKNRSVIDAVSREILNRAVGKSTTSPGARNSVAAKARNASAKPTADRAADRADAKPKPGRFAHLDGAKLDPKPTARKSRDNSAGWDAAFKRAGIAVKPKK